MSRNSKISAFKWAQFEDKILDLEVNISAILPLKMLLWSICMWSIKLFRLEQAFLMHLLHSEWLSDVKSGFHEFSVCRAASWNLLYTLCHGILEKMPPCLKERKSRDQLIMDIIIPEGENWGPRDPEGEARGVEGDSFLMKGDYLPEARGELGVITFCHSSRSW